MNSLKKLVLGLVVGLLLASPIFLPTSEVQAQDQDGSAQNAEANRRNEILTIGVGADNANRGLDSGFIDNVLKGTVLISLFGSVVDTAARFDPFDADTITARGSSVGVAIQNANRFILNLANLFYILVLLLIAVATIFGVEAYGVQRLLPRLIIAILLSNFGLFFVQFITSQAQFLQNGLLAGAGDNSIAQILIGSASAWENLARFLTQGALGVVGYFTGGITVPVQFLLAASNPLNWFTVAFLLIAVVLVLRIVGLWVLAIFAPIGVVLGVLPATAGQAKLYWRKVISYAFVGPVMVFFLRLAAVVWEALQGAPEFVGRKTDAFDTFLGYSYNQFFQIILTVAVLFIGLAITRKMGVEVANFAIGAFQKAFRGAFILTTLAAGAGLKGFVSLLGGGNLAQTIGKSLASRAGRQSETGQRLSGARYLFAQSLFQQLAGKKKDGFGAFGATVFAEASTPLLEGKTGRVKLSRAVPVAGVGAQWERMQRDDPYLLEELRANQPGWLERIGAEGDVKKRKAMMFGAIEQGKVVDSYDPAHDITNQNSISWDDLVTSGNVDQASLEQLRRAAGFHDPRLSDKYRNTPQADRPAVLRQMFGSRVFGGRNAAALNAGALASPLIAKALFDTRKSDLPRFFKTWTDKQNKAFGKGLEQALDVAGTSDNQWRDMARAAIEKGVDPNRVFDPARMQVQPQNRQNLQKTILKEAAGKVSMYQLQSPQGALNLAGDGNLRVEDMARVLKALPKQIAQALRNDAKSLLQQPQVAGQPPPPGGGVGRLTRDQALAVMGNIGVQVANP